ncbi:MAG: hypothetical protein ACD_24C00220G0007, partial [uncultured bacterium]
MKTISLKRMAINLLYARKSSEAE